MNRKSFQFSSFSKKVCWQNLSAGKIANMMNDPAEKDDRFALYARGKKGSKNKEENVGKFGERIWLPQNVANIYKNKAVYGCKVFGRGNIKKENRVLGGN